ncbi:MAG: hypothetical protein NTY77_06085 [Elusimicrobia bacterium]|nr:hypothetical protein [Elusimicrobiota bacterium]
MKGDGLAVLSATAAAVILSAAAGTAWRSWNGREGRVPMGPDMAARAEADISAWPAYSASAARAMMDEYGPPDEVDALHLAWSAKGPWSRTSVHKTAPGASSSRDVLQQSVGYEAPWRKWPALAGFGHGVFYDRRFQELSALSASEESNFLALNLADGIAQGKMSPEAADRLYAKTMAESWAGKSSPAMKGLLFATRPRATHAD